MLTQVWLFATPWTVAHQTPLSMGFARQETLEWVACPPPGHLPDPGIQPASLMSPASAGGFLTTRTTSEAQSEGVSWSVAAWDPMNCSPPGSSVHGILQARMLEWEAIPFVRGSSGPRDQTQVSCIARRFFSIWAARKAIVVIIIYRFYIYEFIYLLEFICKLLNRYWWHFCSHLQACSETKGLSQLLCTFPSEVKAHSQMTWNKVILCFLASTIIQWTNVPSMICLALYFSISMFFGYDFIVEKHSAKYSSV